MTETEKIMEVLRKNPEGMQVTKIAELTGLSRNAVTKLLKELEADGKVTVEVKGCRRSYKPKG
jgi:predicted transcriptional regulator